MDFNNNKNAGFDNISNGIVNALTDSGLKDILINIYMQMQEI